MSTKEKPHRKYYVSEGEAVLFGPPTRTRTWNNSLEGYWYIPLPIGSSVYYTTERILRQLPK
jgi:hypothetical protein